MKVEFKGIVRGAYSQFQQDAEKDGWAESNLSVFSFIGTSVNEILDGLAIDEWIFVIKVNGKRIKDPFDYIQRKGLILANYMRGAR